MNKKSKAADQKRLAVAEIKKDKALVRELKRTARVVEARFSALASGDFEGTRGFSRLRYSAKLRKMSPLRYFAQVILPKL